MAATKKRSTRLGETINSYVKTEQVKEEQIKGQETIETLEDGKYMPDEAKTENKATEEVVEVEVTKENDVKEEIKEEVKEAEVKETAKINVVVPTKAEVRSVRKQIVLTPTLAKKMEEQSKAVGISFNEMVHQILQYYIDSVDK